MMTSALYLECLIDNSEKWCLLFFPIVPTSNSLVCFNVYLLQRNELVTLVITWTILFNGNRLHAFIFNQSIRCNMSNDLKYVLLPTIDDRRRPPKFQPWYISFLFVSHWCNFFLNLWINPRPLNDKTSLLKWDIAWHSCLRSLKFPPMIFPLNQSPVFLLTII